MTKGTAGLANLLVSCGFILLAIPGSFAREHSTKPAFKYVAGTIALHEGCQGKLEMNSTSMIFQCSGGSVEIPYNAILFRRYLSVEFFKLRIDIPHLWM